MRIKDFAQALMTTGFMHVYELYHRNGDYNTTNWRQPPDCINKRYWLLGDKKALEEFREQYHNPYTGYTHI